MRPTLMGRPRRGAGAEPGVIMANIAASDIEMVGRLPIFSGPSGESLAVLLAGARIVEFGVGDPWM